MVVHLCFGVYVCDHIVDFIFIEGKQINGFSHIITSITHGAAKYFAQTATRTNCTIFKCVCLFFFLKKNVQLDPFKIPVKILHCTAT